MRTHTPAPWKVLNYHPGGMFKTEAIIVGPQMESRPPIAKCHPENASLIAAAPELLDAAKACIKNCGPAFEMGVATPDMIKLKAAIAKAEGR